MTRAERLLLPLVAVVLQGSNCQLGTPSATPYSCGTASGGHCYAEATLDLASGAHGNHTHGFRTRMSVPSTLLPGDVFITSEFWLMNIGGNSGWIEIGILSDFLGVKYFWAKLDPSTSIFSGMNEIAPVPLAERGTEVVFDIHETAPDTFSLSVQGAVTSFSTSITLALWNGRDGGWVLMGEELAGTKGAAASFTTFNANQLYDAAYVARYAVETDLIGDNINGPPWGGWLTMPKAGFQPPPPNPGDPLPPYVPGNTGGTFSAYCCAK